MRALQISMIICLLLSIFAGAAEGPIDKGSNFFGGGFAYSNSSGDLYENTDLNIVETELFYSRFLFKRIAIGAMLDYYHWKHGELPSIDEFSFGPTAAYFFGDINDKTLPFLKTAYTFDNDFLGSNSSTGGTFIMGAGLALRLTNHLAIYNELNYKFETLEGESGTVLAFKIGLAGFIYQKYETGSLANR